MSSNFDSIGSISLKSELYTQFITETVVRDAPGAAGTRQDQTFKFTVVICRILVGRTVFEMEIFPFISRWTSIAMAEAMEALPTHKLPQKKYYRQRAHSNPLADHVVDYPVSYNEMDWTLYYPQLATEGDQATKPRVEFADIGCGYGGLLVTLSTMYPDILMVGMEIRVKVSDYVMDRIKALRLQNPGQYNNIACIRTNCMKYLPNYFSKGQLSKMFFLYPDPHFKKTKHKWRIISPTLLAEYAYCLREGGFLYTITDVEEVHEWMVKHISVHPLFERCSEDDLQKDPVVQKLYDSTEEGKKVTRNNGPKFPAVFRRIKDKFIAPQEVAH